VDKALIFDIGGGSTEAVIGDPGKNLLFSKSLQVASAFAYSICLKIKVRR